ncbi:MAG: TlpA disulfide reductase family protein [Planctomycetota bacterium]
MKRVITLVATLALAACQSGGKQAQDVALTPAVVRSTLEASTAEGGKEWSDLVHADKPLMLVFWQSWCGSCVAEAPHVQRASRQYSKQLSVAGIVSGPDDSVDATHLQKTILELGLTYPQVRDRDLSLTRLFQITGTPTVIVLNKQREVVYRGHELPPSLEPYLWRICATYGAEFKLSLFRGRGWRSASPVQ